MTTETLAHDVAWEPSGHLSEVALSVMADGEDALLDAPMHAHLTSCEACAMKLGEIALRSADVAAAFADAPAFVAEVKSSLVAPPVVQAVANEIPNEAVRERVSETRPLSSRRRFPVLAIVAATAVALLGALPTISRVRQQISPLWAVLTDVAPALVKLGPKAIAKMWSAPQSAPMLPVVWIFAVALVAAGLAIASRASKKMLVEGERR